MMSRGSQALTVLAGGEVPVNFRSGREARAGTDPGGALPKTPRGVPMSLKNKTAIVTGGNSGIGMAIALELARQGASIVIDYIANPEATEALEQQITALGDRAIGVEADVSKVAELQKLIDTTIAEFGRVDIMVNNAGI